MQADKKHGTLSSRQQSIVDFINNFWLDRGYPPSIRDIVSGCGLSSTSVADYNLKILERKGCIRRHREVSRGIEMPVRSAAAGGKIYIPVIGTIAAGEPIPVPGSDSWENSASERIEVTRDLLRNREGVYALKVKGRSMLDALVNDGDTVLMQSTNVVENGEMAAVWFKVEREATLKKFYAEAGRIRLQPANSQLKPVYVSPESIEVQGKVIAVIRQLP
jgi:repressor LexA